MIAIERTQNHLDLQRDFFDHVSAGRFDDAMKIFDANGTFRFPHLPPMKGLRRIKCILGMMNRKFSAIKWKTLPEIHGKPNIVISRWTVSGVFATGKKYENRGVSVLELSPQGLVVDFTDYFVSTDFSDTLD